MKLVHETKKSVFAKTILISLLLSNTSIINLICTFYHWDSWLMMSKI